MRTNQTRWILAACFAVALAGVGCGDDEDPMPVAGSGGTSGTGAGTGGTGGMMAGRGGGGGTGGGAAPTVAQCTANVGTVTMNGTSQACAMCACMNNLAAVNACNAMPACWGLIGCIADNCPDDPAFGCAGTTCAQFISGATLASPVGMVLRGAACGAMCDDTDGDGGANDAGL